MPRVFGWVLGISALVFTPMASASLCQAPFMHDGGMVKLGGAGLMQLDAELHFSNVHHQGAQCSAQVKGQAMVSLAGFPASRSDVEYWFTVRDGTLQVYQEVNGQKVPVEGGFDLDLLGIFGYQQGVNQVGQQYPSQAFQVKAGKALQPFTVRTTTRTVEAKAPLQTVQGKQQCWPIRYDRHIGASQVSVKGLKIGTPEISGEVTDWYCPDSRLVMRQDSTQNGVPSYIEVQAVK